MQASLKASLGQPPCQITATRTRHAHLLHSLWRCQAPAHRRGAHNPTCKRACPSASPLPSHPHRQVRLHSRCGRRHVGEEGARAHPRAAPRPRWASWGRRAGPAGGAGRRMLPPGSAKPAAFVPCPPGDPRSTRPAGRPPHGPLQNEVALLPREPAAPPQGLGRESDQAGTSGAHRDGSSGGVCGRRAAARLCGRGGRAGGAATPESHRRRLVLGPVKSRRGAPAH